MQSQPPAPASRTIFIAAVIIVVVVAGTVGFYIYSTNNSPNTPSKPAPHLLVSVGTPTKHTYTDVMLPITFDNNTTIKSYDVWCQSSPYTNNVNWIFAKGVSQTVDIYSAATPSNNYADFGGQYNGYGQVYAPMNPYYLTLHSSDGLQVTVQFNIP